MLLTKAIADCHLGFAIRSRNGPNKTDSSLQKPSFFPFEENFIFLRRKIDFLPKGILFSLKEKKSERTPNAFRLIYSSKTFDVRPYHPNESPVRYFISQTSPCISKSFSFRVGIFACTSASCWCTASS